MVRRTARIEARRGYTGHGHLSLFGLIHMNARLYDPLLGRFLSRSRHQALHREMNEYLKGQTDNEGHHMRPQRGNSGRVIQKYFDFPLRLDALKEFYDFHPLKYWDARYDFYKNNGMLRQWRPW